MEQNERKIPVGDKPESINRVQGFGPPINLQVAPVNLPAETIDSLPVPMNLPPSTNGDKAEKSDSEVVSIFGIFTFICMQITLNKNCI